MKQLLFLTASLGLALFTTCELFQAPPATDSCVDCLEQDPQTLYVTDPETGQVRPLEQGDIDRDPCYWCVQVLNSPLNPPLFDCSSICPCEAAVPEEDHSTLRHTGVVHDEGFFSVLNTTEGISNGLQPQNSSIDPEDLPCVPVDYRGKALLKITYSMKYPCEDLAEIEEESLLTLGLTQKGRKGYLAFDSTRVTTNDLVRDPCCFRDNECILSRTLSFEFTPELDSLGFSEAFDLEFTIEHAHPDTLLPSVPVQGDNAKLTPPDTATFTTNTTDTEWSHSHFYQESIRFCSASSSDQ